jgi:hypothetical protein
MAGRKPVVDMTGKGAYDMSGKGASIPTPYFAGAPTSATASSSMQPNAPVTSRTGHPVHATAAYQDIAGGKGQDQATLTDYQEGEELEVSGADYASGGEMSDSEKRKAKFAAQAAYNKAKEEDEDEDEESEEEKEIKENFHNAIVALLGEDVSPSLVNQLEAVFEAAVKDRVEKNLASIIVELDEGVKNELNTVTETLVEKVDDYLDYVVEEWMTENAVAVEQGIKTQIAENFIGGLKNLFENHYIDVPAEKYNVLDELYAQNRNLETRLNNSINENINLRKEVSLTECAGIFVAETRDLADTQVSKLQNLMENVKFTSPEEYREKLVAIKENYMTGTKPAPARVVDAVDTFAKTANVPTTLVENYASAIARINKKV